MPQKKTVFSGQSLRGWYNFLMRINHSVGVFIGVFTALTLVLGLAFSILHSSSSSAQANFPGWSNIATIYYNSSQEDPNNTFLQQAADELKLQLEKVSGTYTITTTSPPSTGIFLVVNPNLPALAGKNHEAFQLLTDSQGIHITGASPVAVRHGAYTLLERLGFRWYFSHPMWYVAPPSLQIISLNEVQEPFFTVRDMRSAIGELIGGANGIAYQSAWLKRNRMSSDMEYAARHSWPNFASKTDVAAQDPAAVCYKPDGITPQQSLPDHSVVINRALNYARNWFNSPTSTDTLTKQTLTKQSVPISPPDGNTIWCDEWQVDVDKDGDLDYSAQVITDKTFALTNEVAKMLQKEFPGKYASVLSYSWYPNIPSFDLENNVYVQVTTFTRETNLSLQQRLQGYKNMGVLTGVYDYYDVWPWWKDRIQPPRKVRSLLQSMQTATDTNADTFYFEASDNWGPSGRLYWIGSKLMWDPYQGTGSVDAATTLLLDDFYTNAFGPAKEPMKRYYERFDTQTHTDSVMGLAFQDLNEALTLAGGRPEIQDRIWFVFYHTYFWWKWGDNVEGAAFSGVEEAKAMQTFLWKTSDLHMVTSRLQREQVVEPALTSFGLSATDIAALKNITLPTNAESQAWLQEALGAFGVNLIDAPLLDVEAFKPLKAAGDTTLPTLQTYRNTRGAPLNILIPSGGSETVAMKLRSTAGYDWIAPDGTILDTKNFNNLCGVLGATGCTYGRLDLADAQFQLAASTPGLYTLRVRGWSIVDVPNHAASVTRPFGQEKTLDVYFYVPVGTPAFVVRQSIDRTANNTITLTDPSGATTTNSNTSNSQEVGVRTPQKGIWRARIQTDGILGGSFDILGVPPLVWHDPQYFLIPAAQQTVQQIFSISSLPRHHLFQEENNVFEVQGSRFDLNTTFTIKFLQAGVEKKSISVTPTDSTTLKATISSAILADLSPGLYDMVVERSTDSETKTYLTKIAITKRGDLWSSSAIDSSRQKRDGKIDSYDVSRLLTKWNSASAADLTEHDISGPARTPDGKIDIWDANVLMRNWTG